MALEYLSPSQMNMLWRCGEQYRRRYVEGERIPPGVAALVGTGTHKSIEVDLKWKMRTGELLDEQQVADAARDGLNKAWEEGVMFLPEEKAQGEKKVRGAAVDQAIGLAKLHRGELAPTIEPVALEEKFIVPVNGSPVSLLGYIDIREPGGIRDTKTKGRAPGQEEADTSEQFTSYAHAYKAQMGELPKKIYMDCLVKTKVPKVVTYETERTDQDLTVLQARFNQAYKIITAGLFAPTLRSNWWCSPKWCGYYDTCPYAKGRTSLAF